MSMEQTVGGTLWGLFLGVVLLVVVLGCVAVGVFGGAATFEAARAERANAEAARVEAHTARDRESNIHRETMAMEANAHREALVAMVLGAGRSKTTDVLSVLLGGLCGAACGVFIVRRWLWLEEWRQG